MEWSQATPPFPPQASLYDVIRKAPVRKRVVEKDVGNVDEAFKTAARVIEAEYEWPFQSHASMGPACALVEIKDGFVTCYSGTQKSHFVQAGLAAMLDVPAGEGPRQVDGRPRLLWPQRCRRLRHGRRRDRQGGRAARCGCNTCASRAPAWDPKGPASIHRARLGFDAAGKIVAYEFTSKGFSRVDVDTNGGKPSDTLAGQTSA